MLRLWDATDVNPLIMVLRSLSGEERTAELMRDFITRNVMGPVAAALDAPDKELRATLAASQFVGLMIARYVVRLEPLASTSPAILARIVGPNVQRYLTGDLE
jgi:hypothetical protein